MVERFLRLFPLYRAQEAALAAAKEALSELSKKHESDEAAIESLNRYIEALEGRDKERLATIESLEKRHQEACDAILGMRARLSSLLPKRPE